MTRGGVKDDRMLIFGELSL